MEQTVRRLGVDWSVDDSKMVASSKGGSADEVSTLPASCFMLYALGFRVQSLGFGVWGSGLGFRVWGLGFWVWGFGFGVWGLRLRI